MTGQREALAGPSPLPAAVWHACRPGLLCTAGFSVATNLLLLTGPIFMLQVYDRVLASGSVPTLVALGLLVAILYGFYGVLDALRARIMARLATVADEKLAPASFEIAVQAGLGRGGPTGAAQALPDLRRLRQFISGPSVGNLFDLAWMPVYLGIVFLLHAWLGLAALVAGLVLVAMTALHGHWMAGPVQDAMKADQKAAAVAAQSRRQIEVLAAMGMVERLMHRWQTQQDAARSATLQSSDTAALASSFSKTVRLAAQSLILGVGAYLVIQQEMTPGAMIAASIIFARAFAPLEQVTAHWRSLSEARVSMSRLKAAVGQHEAERISDILPVPKATLGVSELAVAPPNSETPTLTDIAFDLEAGDGLGIIGQSGSGKTSLARTLIGAWAARDGEIRLDGATLDQWPASSRGRFIGYLPQDIELFDGTLAENIARFDPDAGNDRILEAATLAGAHELIVGFPQGYDTLVGPGGLPLSAGQRQRIALARAVYGQPFLVILDEPNANLDEAGEQALQSAVRRLRAAGSIVVVIAHRPGVLAEVNKLLWLVNGTQKAFGPKTMFMEQLKPQAGHGGGRNGGLSVVRQQSK